MGYAISDDTLTPGRGSISKFRIITETDRPDQSLSPGRLSPGRADRSLSPGRGSISQLRIITETDPMDDRVVGFSDTLDPVPITLEPTQHALVRKTWSNLIPEEGIESAVGLPIGRPTILPKDVRVSPPRLRGSPRGPVSPSASTAASRQASPSVAVTRHVNLAVSGNVNGPGKNDFDFDESARSVAQDLWNATQGSVDHDQV